MSKESKKAYLKAYRAKNKELLKKKSQKYYQNNKLKIENYYQDNKLEILKRVEKYQEKNKEILKTNRKNNQKKLNVKLKKYRTLNIIKVRNYQIEYRKKNANKLKKQIKNKRKTNPVYALRQAISSCIRNAINRQGFSKSKKSELILGCTFQEFKLHIESQWQSWMSWDNYGNKNGIATDKNQSWDLDHIKPISSAKTEEDIYKLNHYTNFQPLCSYVNRFIKRNTIG